MQSAEAVAAVRPQRLPRVLDRRIAIVGPPFLFLVALYVVPTAILGAMSLWSINDNYELAHTWSLGQYRDILTSGLVLQLLGRSVGFASANTAICLALGFPLAYILARSVSSRFRNVLLVMLIAPSWTSHLIRVYSWMLILGSDGLVNIAARDAGLPGTPYNLLFNRFAVMVALVYVYLPFMVLPLYASLEKIDERVLEAGRSFGASPWRLLRRVIVPLSRAGIIAGCVLTFVPSVGECVAAAILGGRSGYMYGNYISDRFGAFDWPAGAALGIVLLVVSLAPLAIAARFLRFREVWVRA